MTNDPPTLDQAKAAVAVDPDEGERLLVAIIDSEAPERPEAALELVRLRSAADPDSVLDGLDLLEVALTSSEHAVVTEAHLTLGYALLDVAPEKAEARLRDVLAGTDPDSAMEAAGVLGTIVEGPEGEQMLRRALGHPDGSVRAEAGLALAEKLIDGEPGQARALARGVMDDGYGEDRTGARSILERLGDAQ
jgi:hypothetical protein